MRILNQKGIAHHLLLIGLAVLVVGAAGFAGWRVYSAKKLDAQAASGCAGTARLTPGITNSCVKDMKTLLNYHLSGGPSSPISRIVNPTVYDSTTASLVKQFQRSSRITVDGIVGTKETWPALCKISNPPAGFLTDAIVAGCYGSSVSNKGYSQVGTVTNRVSGAKVLFYACRVSGGSTVKYAAYNNSAASISGAKISDGSGTTIASFGSGFSGLPELKANSYQYYAKTYTLKPKGTAYKLQVSWKSGDAWTVGPSPHIGDMTLSTCP